ncbi:MAG: hypothetical protein IT208_18005 [Chthonomonadales bacterium]|nr:hypothetical protein [Chthonomonadales bacterium]
MTRRAARAVNQCIVIAAMVAGAGARSAAQKPLELNWKAERPSAFQGQTLAYVDKDGNPTQPGKPFAEVLRGNGTRAGYMLSHGGVIPSSVRVSVGARTLTPNVDYFVDYNTGMVFFSEAVRSFQSITANYSYVEGQDGSRSLLSLPGMALDLKGASLSIGYGVSSAGGLDFTTYGLALNGKVGSGGSMKGMFYMSTPAGSNGNRVAPTAANGGATPAKGDPNSAKSGHLIAQDLTLKAGNATFSARFQDVSASFNGFQSMRQANAANADTMARIAALEKERGIQRLGFGAGLAMGKGSNLAMDWDRIGDGAGQIMRQSLGFKSSTLDLRYKTQEVGQGFAAFKNLTDGEAGQWAREKGVRRSELSLGFTGVKGAALGFNRNQIGDASGSLSDQLLELNGKGFSLMMAGRKTDAGFARLNDLSDADKTAVALGMRRMFDPNAKASDVTAKDKEQVVREAGLERSQLAMGAALGKQGALAYNQFAVKDGAGDVQRRTLSLNGRGYSFNYLSQSISESFARLGSMSDFERAQLGNEVGMGRTSMGLNLALSRGTSFAYSQLTAGDRNGSMSRQSFAYTTRGLDARLNLGSTGQSFTRAGDMAGLSDAERKGIESERGFQRMDFSANLTAVRGLTLNTYVYDAANSADALKRQVFRHFAAWAPSAGTRVSYLTEGNSSASQGAVTDGVTHNTITFDHHLQKGMKLSLYRDTVGTIAGGKQNPTVTTNFLHFATDRSKPNNLMAETKRVDFGNGHFENTTQVDVNYRASSALSMRFNRLEVDRGSDPSATTDAVEWKWQARPTLSFAGSYAQVHTNNDNDATVKSFALNGALTKNLNFAGSYSEYNLHDKNVKAVSDVSISNAKPITLLGLKDTTATLRYAATNDQHKEISQAVAGRVQGMLGNNKVAVEYSGNLDEKGHSAQSRELSIVGDPNDKLPLHYSFVYKARNVNRGELQLVRNYNVGLRIDKQTNLTYTYSSLPEAANNAMQPLKSSAFALTRKVGGKLDFSLAYTTSKDLAKATCVSKLGAMLQGHIDAQTAVQVGYSVDLSTQNGQRSDGHTISLGYDRRVDATHIFALSTAYTVSMNGAPDSVIANLEIKTEF